MASKAFCILLDSAIRTESPRAARKRPGDPGADPQDGEIESVLVRAECTGANLTFITCMFVQPKHRWHGVGAQLVETCEEKAREHTGGLAVIAYPDSLFMPAGFFVEHGFSVVQENDCAWLLMKAWQDVNPP